MKPCYLGDGAYVSEDDRGLGGIVITANHRDPRYATDRVYLDDLAIASFERWIADRRSERMSLPGRT